MESTVLEEMRNFGAWVGQHIIWLANQIVDDHWPGLLSSAFFALTVAFALIIFWQSKTYMAVLKRARAAAMKASFGEDRRFDPEDLERQLNAMTGKSGRRLAVAFKEFRETLLETGRRDDVTVRNAIRPAAFMNVDDLGFSLKGWRFVPGLLVSSGLLLTFLGLVAVLSSTSGLLPDGQPADQAEVLTALRSLLDKASAKFVISLSGLFCSIVLNIWLRWRASRVEHHANVLADELERRLHFVSLEGLADKQLLAIEDQTASMKELITKMTADLSEPLKAVSQTSMEQIVSMVGQLGASVTSGIGSSLDKVAERIEAMGEVLVSASSGLQAASQQFDTALKSSTEALGASVDRLESLSHEMSQASGQMAENLPVVRDTIEASNAYALKVAEGASQMVAAAKDAMAQDKQAIVSTTETIRTLMRSFESRAAAYDGQLEKAFKTYQDEIAKSVDTLENHGKETKARFTEALSTLQSVIENAKAFEPQSADSSAEAVK